MRAGDREIRNALLIENEIAQEVRFELREIIKCMCDDNGIPLDVCSIEEMLKKVPDRELVPLEPVIPQDQVVLCKYARNLLSQTSYSLKD